MILKEMEVKCTLHLDGEEVKKMAELLNIAMNTHVVEFMKQGSNASLKDIKWWKDAYKHQKKIYEKEDRIVYTFCRDLLQTYQSFEIRWDLFFRAFYNKKWEDVVGPEDEQ